MKKFVTALIVTTIFFTSCDVLKQIDINEAKPLSNAEIISGLKEALKVGTQNAVSTLNVIDGFYGNPSFRVPWPQDALVVEEKLREFGFSQLADDFIKTLNRGAEEAVKEALPIFVNAITQMTFEDARQILGGPDNAATEYFRKKTSMQLFNAFKPKVKNTLDQVQVTSLWSDVMSTYNKIPFVKNVETDLPKYVTNKAIDALFTRVAEEEKQIRTDPAARVTDLLKRVFGAGA